METIELLLAPLRLPFMQRALLAVIMLSLVGAILGVFVVLRNLPFIGEGLAHGSLAGLAVGYSLRIDLYLSATIVAIGLAVAIGYLNERGRVAVDTAIGVLFATTAAVGIIVISRLKIYADLPSYLFGSVLGVSMEEIRLIAAGSLLVLITVVALYKELVAFTFDSELSAVVGLPVRGLHYLLLALIAVAVVLAMQTIGLLLVTALIVIPAAAALQIYQRIEHAIMLAALIGIGGSVGGLYISYYARSASGASIVLTVAAMFFVCFAIGRRRRRI